MTTNPHTEVRDLIALKIHAVDCGCPDYRPDGSDYDDVYYSGLADAAMSLFDLVECQHTADGRCYVLRTTPTGEDADA